MKPLAILALLAVAACSISKVEAPPCPAEGAAPANSDGIRASIWDDARSTFLRFPGNQAVPAITALRTDGVERAVNTTSDPDNGTIMVHGVFPAIVLRDGKRVACLRNRAYDQVGVRPVTGG